MIKCSMQLKMMAFLSVCLFCAVVAHAGFLQPTGFPKTIDDISFVDRMALKSAGYEQFESIYDDNGNCVSGCAYAMPKWEDELAAMERWNRLSRQELIEKYEYTENEDGSLTPPPVVENVSPEKPSVVDFPSNPSNSSNAYVSENQNCAIKNQSFGNRDIPYGSPLGRIICISSPYGPRRLFGRSFHYGIDLNAVTGSPVYSPANGVVKLVFRNNPSCGNGLVIEHSGGYSTKYCHFSSLAVNRGDKVSAGCLIGKSGNTGQSTGPHLHYSVLYQGNAVNPIDFIEPGHKSCYAKN